MQIISTNNDLLRPVTVPEAAKYLGVAKRVIYQLVEYGELRAARENGKIFIDPCSIRQFRDSGKMV